MINKYTINIGDKVAIETVITPHENPEIGFVTTPSGYYDVCYILDEGNEDGQEFWTIGLEVSEGQVLYITEAKEDIITDYIKS